MMAPKVTIIVVTYGEKNERYLHLCLSSIWRLDYPKERLETIVVSSGDFAPTVPTWATHIHKKERLHFPSGVNLGARNAKLDTDFFLILNDDIIVTKHLVSNLVMTAQGNKVICGALSPCDNGLHYNAIMGFHAGGKFRRVEKRFHRFDDWKPYLEELTEAESIYPPATVKVPFLCFYAVLMSREVWEKVGPMDEKFLTGQDDVDFSMRAHQVGVQTIVCLHALVWHFGGVAADEHLTDPIRQQNIKYFKEKWGVLPP